MQSSLICPPWFSVPSTLYTVLGWVNSTVLMPSFLTILGSMKFSVAPLSSSAFSIAFFFALEKVRGMSSVFILKIQHVCTMWAHTQATWVEPPKNPLLRPFRPEHQKRPLFLSWLAESLVGQVVLRHLLLAWLRLLPLI
jgi:hypothetical protein